MVDKVKSVDISALFALYPRNLKKIGETEDEKEKGTGAKVIAVGLEGTDLSYDEKTQQLKVKPSQRPTSFKEEEEYIHSIRKADTKGAEGDSTGGDRKIDLDEAKTLLARHPNLPFSAESYLDHLQKLMERRYNPLAENMKKLRGRYAFDGAIDAMRTYNDGLLAEEKRLAKGQFKSVVKTVGNVGLTVIPVNEAVWAWDHWISSAPGADERKFFLLDRQATSHAEKNFKDREDAIKKLEDFLNDALKKKEAWALAGNFEAAKKKFGESNAEALEVLKTQLIFEEFQRIYSITDQAEFYRALMTLADGEMHGTLTIWGGKSTQRGLYNLTGVVNNYAFRRAVYSFINDTAQLPDKDDLETLQLEADLALNETIGESGDFYSSTMFGLDWTYTGINHLFGGERKQNFQYLTFSDEGASDTPARLANGAMLFSFLRAGREAVGLRGFKGNTELWQAMHHENGKLIKNPYSLIKQLRRERLAEQRRLGQNGAEPHPKMSRYTRWQWNFPVARGMRKLGEGTRGAATAVADAFNMSARIREMAGKAAHAGWEGSAYVVEFVMILGVMDYLDKEWNPKAKPQNYKHDLDLHVLADPTQPDPQFYGPGDLPWLEGPKAGDEPEKK